MGLSKYDYKFDEVKAAIINNVPAEVLKELTKDASLDELAEFYMRMPYATEDAPVRKDNILFVIAFRYLATIQYRKEASYGSSWCKRGEMDVFFNLARKFDRIENIQLNGAKDEVGESKVDTVADLANYAILWMTHTLSKNPALFNQWVANNFE